MKRIFLLFSLILLTVGLLGCSDDDKSKTQNSNGDDGFPEKEIKAVVAFDPGGGHDSQARAVSSVASEHFGVPVVVENRPGASGTIGTEYVMNSEPDGYTIQSSTSAPWIYTPLTNETGYTFEDAEVIGTTGTMVAGIAINSDLPFETIQELFEYVKENPGELKYASGGSAFEALNYIFKDNGYDFSLIPYPGGSPAAVAAAQGEADVVVGSVSGILPFHEDGTLEILLTIPKTDEPFIEGVPVIGEDPEIAEIFDVWPGVGTQGLSFYAPKGIPEDRLDFLEDALYNVSQDEGFQTMMRNLGLEPGWIDRKESQRQLDEIYETVQSMKEYFE